LIVGKLSPYIILGFLDTLEILAIGHWWFGMPIRGDLGLILLLSVVFLTTGLGMGLFASTVANTQQEAMLTVFMTMLPSIFLSGFFFPLEAMPTFLRWFSYLVPLRYFLVIIRSLLLKGVGLEMIRTDVIFMTLFAVGIMTFAVLRFHKRLD
jgi:ABC-2 type transport system permease protein